MRLESQRTRTLDVGKLCLNEVELDSELGFRLLLLEVAHAIYLVTLIAQQTNATQDRPTPERRAAAVAMK